MHTVTLHLSPRSLTLLREVVDAYLADPAGPARECAQEWDAPYSVEEIDALVEELEPLKDA